jgi:hypothetical protein
MKALLIPAFLFCFSTASIPVTQPAPRTLTGKVVDGKNAPIYKAVVYLKNTQSLDVKNFVTRADGSYTFSGLTPNTPYEVYAEYQNVQSATKTILKSDPRTQIIISLQIK